MINWKVRYARILEKFPELFDRNVSLLEVGSGDRGIAQYLKRPVTGLEPQFGQERDPWLVPVNGSIFEIPFGDRSFDTVLCIDVFEHLPREDRVRAMKELTRVAARQVLVSCPCDPFAMDAERQLAQTFQRSTGNVPQWLAEHLSNGLPGVGDMLAAIAQTGHPFTVEGNEGLMQHFGGIFLDYFFPIASSFQQIHERKGTVHAPLAAGASDLYYSYLFTIDVAMRAAAEPGTAPLPAALAPGTPPEGSLKVFAVSHKSIEPGSTGWITPIFAGPAADEAPANALTDILPNGERLLNSRWSELSAMYRVWREGPVAEAVGFCHYRRYLNFGSSTLAPREVNIRKSNLRASISVRPDDASLAALRDGAILTAPPIVFPFPVWIQYNLFHHPDDWCRILGMLSRRYPHLIASALAHFESKELYANNLFVMRWDCFDELCRLWFDVLREFEALVPASRGSSYQNRDVSFLAERVFDIWLRYRISQGTPCRTFPIFYVEDA